MEEITFIKQMPEKRNPSVSIPNAHYHQDVGYDQAISQIKAQEVELDVEKLCNHIWKKIPYEDDINIPMGWAEYIAQAINSGKVFKDK